MTVLPMPHTRTTEPASQEPALPLYASALGLEDVPFPVTPDETHYFFTPQAEAVYEELRHFVEMRKGFLMLTGDIGLGKTTLIRRLLSSFEPSRFNTALILASFLDQNELLEAIVRDFGLTADAGARRIDHLTALNTFLLQEAEAGKINVLFIDDAQALDAEALDVVRQLSNLETAQHKLIQVVLCGQPELQESLNRHELRQVKSRIALHRQLRALGPADTSAYVQHRLACASKNGQATVQLDGAALQTLHRFSRGVPRHIHHLMDRCLYGLVARDRQLIDQDLVLAAWHDLDPTQADQPQGPSAAAHPHAPRAPVIGPRRSSLRQALGLGALGLSLALGFAGLLIWRDRTARLEVENPLQPTQAHQTALAAPAEWPALQERHPLLRALHWSPSDTPQALSQALSEQLAHQNPPSPWRAVAWSGPVVQGCQQHPLLTFKTAQGPTVQLAFLESLWPLGPVGLGETRSAVAATQAYLKSRGWLGEREVDGVMGPRTVSALARWQTEEGLGHTGQFDPATSYRLACRLGEQTTGPKAPVPEVRS